MVRHLQLAALALSFLTSSAWAQTATLREATAGVGINFGMATSSGNVRDASGAQATAIKTHYNMVVCENETKFENTESPIGTFKYTAGDAVSTFAVANKMTMRFHTFIWHSQSSSAQNAVTNRTTGLTVMRNHIEALGGHFKDKILEWDVLNETYSGGTNSLWYKIGADYTDSALTMARRVIGTSGYLYSNDYGADGVNNKSTAILNIAKKWQDNKVPLDGIGFQCHLSGGVRKDDISANIKRFGDLGLRVSLTEIDIQGGSATDWANLMTACLENFNCMSFLTWGITDAASWINNCTCLLFTGNPPTPKAAFHQAMLDAIAKADPAVTAKRKAFAAISPGSLGPNVVVGVYDLSPRNIRRGGKNLSILAPMPTFQTNSGVLVDPLGRAKSVAPARLDGLEILRR